MGFGQEFFMQVIEFYTAPQAKKNIMTLTITA
jgi:hypothetical protein